MELPEFIAIFIGFFSQVLLRTGGTFFSKRLVLPLGVSTIISALFLFNSNFSFSGLIFVFPSVFLLGLVVEFNKELLIQLTEQRLLQESLISFYVLWLLFPGASAFSAQYFYIVFLPMCALTALTLVACLSKPGQNAIIKTILYVWFLILQAIFASYYISNLFSAFGQQAVAFSLFDAFILGTLIFSFTVSFVNILHFTKGKRENLSSYMLRLAEQVSLLTSKYTDVEMSRKFTAAIILLQGGVLVANYFTNFISPMLLISISLLVSSFVSSFISRPVSQPSAGAAAL